MAPGPKRQGDVAAEGDPEVGEGLFQVQLVDVEGARAPGQVALRGERTLALDEGADVLAQVHVDVHQQAPQEKGVIGAGDEIEVRPVLQAQPGAAAEARPDRAVPGERDVLDGVPEIAAILLGDFAEHRPVLLEAQEVVRGGLGHGRVLGGSRARGERDPGDEPGAAAHRPATAPRRLICPRREKSIDSARIRADSWSAWNPLEFSASTKSA